MKDWNGRLREELVPRTLAELYGSERLLVEHHRGIVSYGADCIRMGATFGFLIAEGENLRLCCMSRSQLVICGKIRCLRMEEG